jgi:CRP/FNR family transcriptional regulator
MLDQKVILLRETPIFSQIRQEDLLELARHSLLREFSDGRMLFRAGDRAEGFYIVAEGAIEVFRGSAHRREQTLHVFGEGEVCGEVPLFSGSTYPASARARGSLKALVVPGDVFFDLAHRHPDMLLEMLAVLSRRLRGFADIIAELSLKDVQQRLGSYLLDLSRKQDDRTFRLDASKGRVAAQLGTIQETLSRALAKMASRGWIEVHGKTITIKDVEAIEEMSRE